MMAEPRIRAGIIGLGVGEKHIEGYRADDRCRVVALCDIDPEKLEEVGGRYPELRLTADPTEILNDPSIDVVSIASYDDAHFGQVKAAIENGKHVFVEKPLCLHQREFNAIRRALAEHPGVRLSSNLILRRTDRFSELKRRVAAGTLGRLYYLEGDYDYGRVHKITQGWRAELPFYSVVHGGAIHLVDLILWLTQRRVVEVFAWGNQLVTLGTPFTRADFVAALLRFEDDTIAKVSANFGSVTPHHHKFCVYGTNGAFIQSHMGAAYYWSRDSEGPSKPEHVRDSYPGIEKGDLLGGFISHILDGTQPDVTAQEVLTSMEVSLAIERSLESGQPEGIEAFLEDNGS